MQELRLVAVSEDGSYAVLAVPGRGKRFSLPIDDRLRTVARGQFSRLAQYEIEVENPLRPKEIQDRIRAGETAEEIADAAGLPIDRVRRFEGPVLAEREYRAQEAQRATVRGQGEPGPGPRLGDVVAGRLAECGAAAEDTTWDSRKRQDGNWQVRLSFFLSGRPQVAEWIFDPRRRHVAPADDQAVRLCLPEADWSAARFVGRNPATATVTPIGSRHGASGAYHPEAGGEPQRLAASGPAGPFAPAGPFSPDGPGAGELNDGPAGGMLTGTGPAVPAGGTAGTAGTAGTSPAAAARAARDRGRAADLPRDDQEGDSGEHDSRQPARPARKAAASRSKRASVPSWDEIMFGNTRQRD